MGTKCKGCGGGMLVLLDTYTCLKGCGGKKKPVVGTNVWWPSVPVEKNAKTNEWWASAPVEKKEMVAPGIYTTVDTLARHLIMYGGSHRTLGELIAIVPAICSASTHTSPPGIIDAPRYQLYLSLKRGSVIADIPLKLAHTASKIVVRNAPEEDVTVLKDRMND